jgi:hypothetical protein
MPIVARAMWEVFDGQMFSVMFKPEKGRAVVHLHLPPSAPLLQLWCQLQRDVTIAESLTHPSTSSLLLKSQVENTLRLGLAISTASLQLTHRTAQIKRLPSRRYRLVEGISQPA